MADLKTLRFVRFDFLGQERYTEIRDWCTEAFGAGGMIMPESRWWYTYPTFYFRDDADYMWFKLRWQ